VARRRRLGAARTRARGGSCPARLASATCRASAAGNDISDPGPRAKTALGRSDHKQGRALSTAVWSDRTRPRRPTKRAGCGWPSRLMGAGTTWRAADEPAPRNPEHGAELLPRRPVRYGMAPGGPLLDANRIRCWAGPPERHCNAAASGGAGPFLPRVSCRDAKLAWLAAIPASMISRRRSLDLSDALGMLHLAGG
jgi:hypothetical protein